MSFTVPRDPAVPLFLTIDLGTTSTKAALWDHAGMLASAPAPVPTSHPRPGWAEQDPADWWSSVVASVTTLGSHLQGRRVDAIGLCGARETFVATDQSLRPLGPGILWSDRRAAGEAEGLAAALGGLAAARERTGLVPDAGVMAAKVAWLASSLPEIVSSARWFLSPRDWVGGRLTGVVATDPTMASKTGFYALDGTALAGLAPPATSLLAPVIPSASVLGSLQPDAAAALGLAPGTPVVIGAGDRACEVLGAAATSETPMVSWGTTANASVPVDRVPDELPPGIQVTKGALGGWLLEAGLSASGAAIAWLASLTGTPEEALLADLDRSEPGARGVLALPWFNGARAPWWEPGARAAFVGLTTAHGAGDLARAIIEGVAFDVERSLERLAPAASAVQAAGGGSAGDSWCRVLAAVTHRPVIRRAHPDAASVGACLIAAEAIGAALNGEHLNPVVSIQDPDASLVTAYAGLRALADGAAAAVLHLDLG